MKALVFHGNERENAIERIMELTDGLGADVAIEAFWIRDVTITTGLVDTNTTPRPMKLIDEGRLDPTPFATHRFELGETEQAFDTFADAATTNALEVVLSAHPVNLEPARHEAVAGAGV